MANFSTSDKNSKVTFDNDFQKFKKTKRLQRSVSIAITTAPTKTAYKSGEKFDPTGMVVTATYGSSTTQDVTKHVTYTPETITKKGY